MDVMGALARSRKKWRKYNNVVMTMTFEEIMEFNAPRNQQVFEEICRQSISTLTPFIGAGLSAAYFPTWSTFLANGFKSLGYGGVPKGLNYF